MQISTLSRDCTPDEVAAALAAVVCLLAEEAAVPPVAAVRAAWQVAGIHEAQGIVATRDGANSTWATIDRANRESRWSSGITGL